MPRSVPRSSRFGKQKLPWIEEFVFKNFSLLPVSETPSGKIGVTVSHGISTDELVPLNTLTGTPEQRSRAVLMGSTAV